MNDTHLTDGERVPTEVTSPGPTAAPVHLPDPMAILFDLDGTIVDTVHRRTEAWMRTFGELGIPAVRSHVDGLIGSDGRSLAREVAALAGRPIDDARAEAIDRRAGELFTELNVDPEILPGVEALISALRESDLLWSIATSSRREQVDASIASLGLEERPRVTDGSRVRNAKPAPDLLLLAAEELGVPPRHCWYVGDARWDMLAARAAGMVGIGITSGAADEPALRRAGATLVFSTMDGLHADLRARGLVTG
jgi:HAD superfamily hydrolase (TIGR01509 family)